MYGHATPSLHHTHTRRHLLQCTRCVSLVPGGTVGVRAEPGQAIGGGGGRQPWPNVCMSVSGALRTGGTRQPLDTGVAHNFVVVIDSVCGACPRLRCRPSMPKLQWKNTCANRIKPYFLGSASHIISWLDSPEARLVMVRWFDHHALIANRC